LFVSNDQETIMASLSPIEMIQRNADLVIQSTYQQFGVTLSYDEESVEWLDDHIEELREKNYPQDDINMLINVLGSFYGECIRQQYGGEWTDYRGAYMVRLENGQLVSPFSKVMKQFESGVSQSVKLYFDTIPQLTRKGDTP